MNQVKFGKALKYVVIGAGVINIFLQLANFVLLEMANLVIYSIRELVRGVKRVK